MSAFLNIEYHVWADIFAGIFSVLAIILCILQIVNHVKFNHRYTTRKYIIRILCMVIVYSVEAFCGLFIHSVDDLSIYLDAIRDTYEAIVIYSFYQLLIESLGGSTVVYEYLRLIEAESLKHFTPFNYCLKPWRFRGSFIHNTKLGVLQYCLVQPTCALITFILQLCNKYNDGDISWDSGYVYIANIRSISQIWSMYCLVYLYMGLRQQNQHSEGYRKFMQLRPVPKFLCIKGVVFFTFWQYVVIAFLVYIDVIGSTASWSSDDIAVGLQDFLICIEMFIAAIAHIYAFKIVDFQKDESEENLLFNNNRHRIILDVVNVADIIYDTKTVINDKIQRKKQKKQLRMEAQNKITNTIIINDTTAIKNSRDIEDIEMTTNIINTTDIKSNTNITNTTSIENNSTTIDAESNNSSKNNTFDSYENE